MWTKARVEALKRATGPNLSALIPVMYANEDEDITLGMMSDMMSYGQRLANEEGRAVSARCPTTDKVLAVFEPAEGFA